MAQQDTNEFLFKPTARFILDANSPVPLYHQMEQILQAHITQKNSVGLMVPPEKDLMEIFGVSRATIKRTLDNLTQKGLIERRRAVGTRVIRHEITEDLAKLTSYTEELACRGLELRSELLSAKAITPDQELCEKLNLEAEETVLEIVRLRGSSEYFPVVLLRSFLPMSLGITPDENLNGSLYDVIEKLHGIPIEWADETIQVKNVNKEEAKLLGLKAGEGALVMERLTVSRNERPIEFVRGVYHPDHYKFHVRLHR